MLFYLTANDGRLEPGEPSAGTSYDNMMAKLSVYSDRQTLLFPFHYLNVISC